MENSLIPNLHDWEIIGLDIDREHKEVTIKLWFPDTGAKATLSLEGVSRFHCSGVMLQNVILDFLVFEQHTDSDYLKYCYKTLNIDSAVFSTLDSQGRKYNILYVEPSVGVELACTYKSMQIIDNE